MMRGWLLVVFGLLPLVGVGQQLPIVDWAYRFSNTYPPYRKNEAHSVAIDSAGNSYLIGSFYDTVDFDPSPTGVHELVSNGLWDIFLLKLDTGGNFVNVWQIGGAAPDGVSNPPLSGGYSMKSHINIDADGNIYLVFYAGAEADIDPSANVQLISDAQDNLVIEKIDPNGNLLWYVVYDGDHFDQGLVLNMWDAVIDDDRSMYLTGLYSDTVDLDASVPGTAIVNPNHPYDYYSRHLFKLDSVGGFDWGCTLPPKPDHTFISTSGARSEKSALAIDHKGNVICVGYFTGTKNFELPFDTISVTSSGLADVFIAKISKNGEMLDHWQLEGVDPNSVAVTSSITVSPAGNIYVVGSIASGAFDFDPGSGTHVVGQPGGYLLKLSSEGEFRWVQTLGPDGPDIFGAVAVDINENPWVQFVYYTGLDFQTQLGNVLVPEMYPTVGSGIVKFDSLGTALWANVYATASQVIWMHWSMEAYPNGGVLASGTVGTDTINVGMNTPSNIYLVGQTYDPYMIKMMDDISVGIGKEPTDGKGLLVYPNPCTNVLNIHSYTTMLASIEVTDMLGRTIETLRSAQGNKWAVDTSTWPSGIYLLHATNGQGTRSVVKVVKE
ncbi:MAG: T9SS type A sorting domain-containing protein [Flavobacteriales bacterium]|nr:T9SS type A sorting domain-containing protein [Flavobacteriales bacterium]